MTGRLRYVLPVLLAAALIGATCGEEYHPIDPCTVHTAPALTPPTGAELLTDTVDIRSGWDSILVGVEGYRSVINLDRVYLSLRLPSGWDTEEFLFPVDAGAQSGITVYAGTDFTLGQSGDSAPWVWQSGIYRITGLMIQRVKESCLTSGDYYDQVSRSPTELGMTDSTFVFLRS